MAQHDRYRSNGSAAYDIYAEPLHKQNTAQPVRKPERLPEVPTRTAPVRKQKAKIGISPFAVLGTVVAALMVLTVLFSYVRLYETKSEIGALESELAALNEEQARLQSQYDNALDLEAVEKRAKELNMRQAGPSQIVYVQVDTTDTAEVYTAPEKQNFFARIFDAFKGTFTDAVEYFS